MHRCFFKASEVKEMLFVQRILAVSVAGLGMVGFSVAAESPVEIRDEGSSGAANASGSTLPGTYTNPVIQGFVSWSSR
jgi:hypothetical protein